MNIKLESEEWNQSNKSRQIVVLIVAKDEGCWFMLE